MTTADTDVTAPAAPDAPQAGPVTGADDGSTEPSAVKPAAGDNTSREAAKWRRQLRQVEAERDSLAGRVAGMQRQEVERAAAATMAAPADLWTAGVTLDDLLTDEGDLDPDKLDAAVSTVLAERPHWGKPTTPSFDGGIRTSAPTGNTWGDLLRTGRT